MPVEVLFGMIWRIKIKDIFENRILDDIVRCCIAVVSKPGAYWVLFKKKVRRPLLYGVCIVAIIIWLKCFPFLESWSQNKKNQAWTFSMAHLALISDRAVPVSLLELFACKYKNVTIGWWWWWVLKWNTYQRKSTTAKWVLFKLFR